MSRTEAGTERLNKETDLIYERVVIIKVANKAWYCEKITNIAKQVTECSGIKYGN